MGRGSGWMMACAWTLLFAVGAVGCSSNGSHSHSPSARSAAASTHWPDTKGATTPACRADQLAAQVFFVPAGAGIDEYRIRISDTGTPCSLPGRPTALFGVGTAGRLTALHPTPLSADEADAMTTGRPARLTAEQAGEVVVVTSIGCFGGPSPSPADMFASLRLGIGSRTIPVPFGGGPEPSDTAIWLPCGVAMSDFDAAA